MLALTVPETRSVGAGYARVWLKRPIGCTAPSQRRPAVALRLPWMLVVTPASAEASPASLSAVRGTITTGIGPSAKCRGGASQVAAGASRAHDAPAPARASSSASACTVAAASTSFTPSSDQSSLKGGGRRRASDPSTDATPLLQANADAKGRRVAAAAATGDAGSIEIRPGGTATTNRAGSTDKLVPPGPCRTATTRASRPYGVRGPTSAATNCPGRAET